MTVGRGAGQEDVPPAESDVKRTAADQSQHVDGPPRDSMSSEGVDINEGTSAEGEGAPATYSATSPCAMGLAAKSEEGGRKGSHVEAPCGGEREGNEPEGVPEKEVAGIEGRGVGGVKREEEVAGQAATEEGEEGEDEAEGQGYAQVEVEDEEEDDASTTADGGEAGEEAASQGQVGDVGDDGGMSGEEGRAGMCGPAVVCITGDRAMQNVLLQMGLGLRAPSGQRVTSVRTFVLRCTACTRISHVRDCPVSWIWPLLPASSCPWPCQPASASL